MSLDLFPDVQSAWGLFLLALNASTLSLSTAQWPLVTPNLIH